MKKITGNNNPKARKNPAIIDQYEHKDKERLNNPPIGLVDARTDNGGYKKKTYAYDPHIDPQLQWAGKAEHTSFDVPVVSLHVHERIDSRRIIETAQKEVKEQQLSLFEQYKRPLREAIEFYKHRDNWCNRLVAGDSLLVMNSLLEKEGMGCKVQMVYLDPPYGIKYGSNFQPFVNKRDVQDGKDEDLTSEPEMIKAFRDTWELGIHSYLTYLRDRLLLARELLHESGSVFVQISDENVHHVREIMDEVFGKDNFVSLITFRKTTGVQSNYIASVSDYLIWYAKDKTRGKFRNLYKVKGIDKNYQNLMLSDGSVRKLTDEETDGRSILPSGAKIFRFDHLLSSGPVNSDQTFIFNGKKYNPPAGNHWKTTVGGMNRLAELKRIMVRGNTINYIRFLDDFPAFPYTNFWDDTTTGGDSEKIYVVQTTQRVIERCLLMTTDPGDLIFDPTCGSGTTAYVAEQWGRRWITCDTSRVALTLAKQRLMTASFDYYELAHPDEGVGSGFKYKNVSHVTLKSIANNEPAPIETLYDQPFIDGKRLRVTGPFTVEAVPAPVAKSFDEVANDATNDVPPEGETTDVSVARRGETLRQSEWRDELLRSGVRAKGGKLIEFTRVEPIGGTHYLQAEAETREDKPKRVLICFGPEHAPLESSTVEFAIDEAGKIKPGPEMVLFCAFQFDEEAAKDIDETNWPGVTLLKAQMNADLLTDDLKKKRAGSESFWLIGQPDVTMTAITSEEDKAMGMGKYRVEVQGFDYYNPKTGTVESGGKDDISMWMIDTDYDGRSLFPSQVFFPMAGAKDGWAILAKNLKAGIDEESIEAFRGTTSLPFTPGLAVVVKIIDARGIESIKIIRMDRNEIN